MAARRPPWNYKARPYQAQVFTAFDDGILRQFHVWHRRAGKDTTGLAVGATRAHAEIGTYWHLFPKQTQSRRAIWHGINREGRKFIDDAFPLDIRAKTRDQEMMIELACGSTWQMAGSDNYNSLVGSNVRGCIFSEWALCDPNAWPYIMPILRENGGWAIFITTFRGFNHAWRMHQSVRENPEWRCSVLTINDTAYADGRPIFTAADLEAERRDGMDEATIREEYFCEPQRATVGSYYGKAMQWLEREGHFGPVGYEPGLPLFASWHVAADALACVLVQTKGTESRFVASKSWRMTTVSDALEELREKVPFARHIRACIVNASPLSFERAGYEVEHTPAQELTEGIETVRRFLPSARIDTSPRQFALDGNNQHLVDSLNGFRAEHAKRQEDVFQSTPAKTWESYLAEAVRTWAAFQDDDGMIGWGKAPNHSQSDRAVI